MLDGLDADTVIDQDLPDDIALRVTYAGVAGGSPFLTAVSEVALSSAIYISSEGTGFVTITAIRNNTYGDCVVPYTTADGSALNGLDYLGGSGTFTIPNGQTGATFAIPIIDRPIVQANRTFTVSLLDSADDSVAPGSYFIGPNQAVVTITDPALAVSSVRQTPQRRHQESQTYCLDTPVSGAYAVNQISARHSPARPRLLAKRRCIQAPAFGTQEDPIDEPSIASLCLRHGSCLLLGSMDRRDWPGATPRRHRPAAYSRGQRRQARAASAGDSLQVRQRRTAGPLQNTRGAALRQHAG
jgi:hypothetical protein